MFVTVVVILAVIALGVLLIHLLNSQHGDRIAAFHYGRFGMPAPGPARSVPHRTHGRTGTSGTGDAGGSAPSAAPSRERGEPSLGQALSDRH
jgi:hypothetical protein